jgi:DNA-binding NtrC family response regulator
MTPKVFVVDDEHYTLDFFEHLLNEENCKIYKFSSAQELLTTLENETPDLIISDIVMPEMDGIELLEEIKRKNENIPVMLMTAFATIEKAVEAIKKGAFDFFTKPFDDIDNILLKVKKGIENGRLKNELKILQENINELYGLNNIIAKSKAMHDIFSVVKKIAKINSNVLIEGESGTGKELIARAIHNLSDRKNNRFLPINCAAIPESLEESLFFGYEKGAFTGANSNKKGYFEEANNGTLFLDEIGETSLSLQAKLLRVLQDKKVKRVGGSKFIETDIRLICATNRDLEKEVDKGNFRNDLFYRINVIKINLPPLRKRMEDIPVLVDYFIKKYNAEFNKNITGATPEFYKKLYEYDWPGNVRELENVIERCAALEDGKQLKTDFLPETMKKNTNPNNFSFNFEYKKAKQIFEKEYLKRVLDYTNGNIQQASKLAKIDPATFHRKINKYLK